MRWIAWFGVSHRDPYRRWQSAADLADELRWIASTHRLRDRPQSPRRIIVAAESSPPSPLPSSRCRASALASRQRRRRRVPHPAECHAPRLRRGRGAVARRVDGGVCGWTSSGGGAPRRLFVRRLDALEARPIAGTEGAMHPFFSPDGQSVAFFNAGQLMKWSVATDTVTTVADLADRFDSGSAASWAADGTLLFGHLGDQPHTGIRHVAASGGEPGVLTRPETPRESNPVTGRSGFPVDK